ncbi:tRNA lysidine(34) synthetase TilS, partial [uncultured Desulfovibrio sp.]
MIPVPELRTLPSRLARLCLDVERFCRDRLKMQDSRAWLLAVSGGADSTALLCIMTLLAPRHGWLLHVATVDHQLRPESAGDAAFVAGLCRTWHIPCRILTADVSRLARQNGLGTEEAARRARYALLEQARRACGATAILLGHHRGDVAEDQMLRFLRGTGWPALGGMRAEDAERHLLRPLLCTESRVLKELLHHCGITWREDASNADIRYTRNRLRH